MQKRQMQQPLLQQVEFLQPVVLQVDLPQPQPEQPHQKVVEK
jgi:hypothetical protein